MELGFEPRQSDFFLSMTTEIMWMDGGYLYELSDIIIENNVLGIPWRSSS